MSPIRCPMAQIFICVFPIRFGFLATNQILTCGCGLRIMIFDFLTVTMYAVPIPTLIIISTYGVDCLNRLKDGELVE